MPYGPMVGIKHTGTAQTNRRPKGELLSIQYLRAFAAICVLVFHAAQRGGANFGPGAGGVDIFFVVSGFIIWVVGARRPQKPAAFLGKRAARIVPLYWFVTLALAAVALLAPWHFDAFRFSAPHLAKSLFFVPYFGRDGTVTPVLAPGWTLDYEFFFYLVFAGTLFVPQRVRPWLLTTLLGSFVLFGLMVRPQGALLQVYTDPLLLEFLAGVLLGMAWRTGQLPGRVAGAAMIGAGIVLYAAIDVGGIPVDTWRVVLWGVPTFLIVCGAVAIECRGGVPEWRAMKFLGDASYSIYLVHTLAISAAAHLIAPGAPLVVSGVALGLTAGILCYVFLERPLLAMLRRPRRTQPRVRQSALSRP